MPDPAIHPGSLTLGHPAEGFPPKQSVNAALNSKCGGAGGPQRIGDSYTNDHDSLWNASKSYKPGDRVGSGPPPENWQSIKPGSGKQPLPDYYWSQYHSPSWERSGPPMLPTREIETGSPNIMCEGKQGVTIGAKIEECHDTINYVPVTNVTANQ